MVAVVVVMVSPSNRVRPAVVIAVKRAVIADLTSSDLAQRQPPGGERARLRAATSAREQARRDALLAKAWAPDVLARHESDVASALRTAARDPQEISLLDARFAVDEWLGVDVSGDRATAAFTGEEELRFSDHPGTWVSRGRTRYDVQLALVNGSWLMESVHAAAVGP